MARILLGITGGIAAYKTCELVRLLVKAGHDVLPLPTRGAERFVRAETFFALARKLQSLDPYPHLERVDLLVVAPLTANTLAKLAHGLADNVLTEAALAHRGPMLVAPAMNTRMWEHEATQANAATLRERGVQLIGPEAGELAEGEIGLGRMSEPEEIARRVEELLRGAGGSLAGAHVLVSAGGTREPIDSVRYVGNRSSGRMGLALAEEAARRGAEVTVVAANIALARLPVPGWVRPTGCAPGIRFVDVETAAQLEAAASEEFERADVLLMAAAVADYRPTAPREDKLKKIEAELELLLERTDDVLAGLAARARDDQLIVGFAAETGALALEYGREKLARKRLDAVVVNDVAQPGIGFDSTENEVTILTPGQEQHVPRSTKAAVAAAVLDAVLSRRSSTTLRV